MDPRLTTYIEHVRDVCGGRFSMSAKLHRIGEAARRLVAEPVTLPTSLRRVPESGYGRNLIWADPDHGFVVIALVWPVGEGTPVHDHGTWGCVAVSEGRIRVRTYRREDDGSEPGRARFVPLGEAFAEPGDVATTLPPHDDYHDITNALTDGTSITIHTYGVNMKACRVFDVERGTAEIRKLRYTNEPELEWSPELSAVLSEG